MFESKKRLEDLKPADQAIVQQTKEREEKWRQTIAKNLPIPPEEHLKKALETAGLPGALPDIIGRICVFSFKPERDSAYYCTGGRIEGVDLFQWATLDLYISCMPRGAQGHLMCNPYHENNKWTAYLPGDGRAPFSSGDVSDFKLL